MGSRLAKARNAFKKYRWKEMGGLWAVIDCAFSRLTLGSTIEEYVGLEFYRKSFRERNKYLTCHRQDRINKKYLAATTKEEHDRIGNKLQFDLFFKDYVHREFLAASAASEAEIRAFVGKHSAVLAKPLNKTQGIGILRVTAEELDDELIRKFIREDYLLEEFIAQHHKMAEINDTSVNTVRIATAVDRSGHAHPIGACVRCGARGSFVDNTHAGGVAFPIDIGTGIVIGSGKNRKTTEIFLFHPDSRVQMVGFQIPNWDILIERLTAAAETLPQMRYLGWDIAVTEDGVEFVEANYGHSAVGIQSDHVGKYKMVRSILYD